MNGKPNVCTERQETIPRIYEMLLFFFFAQLKSIQFFDKPIILIILHYNVAVTIQCRKKIRIVMYNIQ